jgi:5'(3')-deoxyribonucleotidase
MDGVLADFDGGLLLSNDSRFLATKKELDKQSFELLKNGIFAHDNESLYRLVKEESEKAVGNDKQFYHAYKKAYQKHRSSVMVIAKQPGFFRNLKTLPSSQKLVDAALLYDKAPSVCTAPILINGSIDNCKNQKFEWIKEHFPLLTSNFNCTEEKGECAFSEPNIIKILIDDREKYTSKWEAAGGIAILHTSVETTINQLKELCIIHGFSA